LSAGHPESGKLSVNTKYRFYEKVVKVKADVAALHSFLPSDHVRSGPTSGRRYIG
jgi:hypothetical protein